MNYDQLNQIHDYWYEDVAPHLVHQYTVTSFDDYLRKFSFLPSGKWLHDMENLKLRRIIFLVDPIKFAKKYKEFCVTYNAPVKAEDGFQRVIYQLSPTMHIEAAFYVWIEHKIVQSYVTPFVCHNVGVEKEYATLIKDLYKIRREGNTEDKPKSIGVGFAGFQSADGEEDVK
jgi:hypothetical protein